MPEGTVSFILNRNDIWKFGTLTVSPFDWLEASYFYYRPSDLVWEGNLKRGHYLDKGFNVKFVFRPENKNIPNLAIGLDDFAGTGYFTKEYIIATKEGDNTKFTFGLGWGRFAGQNTFTNPLSDISDGLNFRPERSDNYNTGGSLSYDQWFRGESTFLGGIEYIFPKFKRLSLKLEYDPYDYFDFSASGRSDALENIRKKKSNANIGISYSLNENLNIDASFIKGNTFNLSFSFGFTFSNNDSNKKKFKPDLKIKKNENKSETIFYENLLNNLNRNRLLLQTATLHENNNLDISISTSDHRNAIRSSSYAAYIAKNIADNNDIDLSMIRVSHINAGIELNNIGYIANHLKNTSITPIEVKIRNTKFEPGDPNGFKKDKFKPNVDFPVVFSSFNPSIVSHLGNPEKFYFGGLNLQNITEIQFSRNLLLSSELNLRLYDNFQDTISGPASLMEHVRTDLVQYLKEDDIYITRMQLDYIWSPYKNTFAKISGGIYEAMFGGIGGEFLYRPFNRNFDIGAELFIVKQRAFNQAFDFQDYKTVTGHLNMGYRFGSGIETKLSYGRYLAKDDGYTLDIGRTTIDGFKAGIYFTRTNVSSELFGEGSFDKGFYFQFPLDFFSSDYNGNYSTVKLSPLTRDGGAKLIHDKDLRGLIYNSTIGELNRQWNGFLN